MAKPPASCGRTGSVLMEFLIVSPLYFILLGGLFAVADLAVGRIRLHVADQFVTWVGSSRMCPFNANGDPDGDLVESVLLKMYDRSIGGALASNYFKVSRPEDDGIEINSFMGFYKGGVLKLEVDMPLWARGMLQVRDMTTGRGPLANGLPGKVAFSCDYERSYCFNRLELNADAEFDRSRSVPASDLAVRGYVSNVALDNWIGGPSGSSFGLTTAPAGLPAGRILGKFAE